jgi:hypothetical protein
MEMFGTKVDFGKFKNVEYYFKEVGNEVKCLLCAVENDNFKEVENNLDWMDDDKEEENYKYCDAQVEKIANEMVEYLKSVGIESEIYDEQIGYGQELVNLVVAIDENDLVKLKAS